MNKEELKNQVFLGDCLKILKQIPENSVDSVVTDPPYGINFMGNSWDYNVPDVEKWKEILRVLKPGGHLLSFAGTRTQHRMAVNIEDAGFEIRDMITWVYSQGFPKSYNIGKGIDKIRGNERDEFENPLKNKQTSQSAGKGLSGSKNQNLTITKGYSEWEGWGTALKPALEPITMARKPLEGTVINNILKWETGGINIDESRVEYENNEESFGKKNKNYNKDGGFGFYDGSKKQQRSIPPNQGRFPANLIHDGSEEVKKCFPQTSPSPKKTKSKNSNAPQTNNVYGKYSDKNRVINGYNDSGNASRYFKSIIYQAKASKKERGSSNNHPTLKPVALIEYLIKLVTPKNGLVLDPFAGSMTTAIAAINVDINYLCIEKGENYYNQGLERIKNHNKKETKNINEEFKKDGNKKDLKNNKLF